jgi:MFS transporter, AAHS family, 4-hydroxybenzoate transporter
MERVAAIMQKMVPDRRFPRTARFTLEPQLHGITVRHLFTEGRAPATILIWIAFVMNLFVLVYLVFWLPTLLRQAGQPLEVAIRVTIFYGIGGICGGLTIGWIADRVGSLPGVLALGYVGGAIFIAFAALSVHDIAILIPAVFMSSFAINGGQASLNTLSATYYPTAIRATGVGWALGIGRTGSILGPSLGGLLIAHGWDAHDLFLAAAGPVALACICAILLSVMLREPSGQDKAAEAAR